MELIGKDGKIVEFAADARLASLRIVDPVNTALAQGYTNDQFVSDELFPVVMSKKMSGKFPAFGKEAFRIYNTKRGLSGVTMKIKADLGSVLMELQEHSLGFMLDSLELEEYVGTPEQLRMARQQQVSESLRLERESLCAVLATTDGNYTNKQAGAGLAWAGAGDPIVDCDKGRFAVRGAVGRFPNTCIFDPTAWQLFINNAKVLDRIKYTGRGIVTEDLAASLLQVPKVTVAKNIMDPGTGTFVDTWGQVQTGNVIMAWTGSGFGVPGFGYTYMKEGYPNVTAYRLEQNRSDVYDEQQIYSPAITLATAGWLAYGIK